MDDFGKLLIIRNLRFNGFFSVANSQKSRRRYGAIALPLRCNRVAVTVQSRRHYGVTATAFGYYRNKNGSKCRRRCCEEAEGYPFPALNAPVSKC